MESLIHSAFTDVKRSKYIYEFNTPRDHVFSGIKASIANKCSVALAEYPYEGVNFAILSVTWSKPHYFIINTLNSNVLWVEGKANFDLENQFVKQYTLVTSLNNWIQTLRTLAKDELLVQWARCGKFIKPNNAKKTLAKMNS